MNSNFYPSLRQMAMPLEIHNYRQCNDITRHKHQLPKIYRLSLSRCVCMDGTECTTVFAIANDGTPLALFTSMLTFHVA